MLKIKSLILVYICTAICAFSQNALAKSTVAEPSQQEIDSIFSEWEQVDQPGGTVAVIKEGKLIFSKGYGLANIEHSVPNTPATVFRIASTSKQFTAATIILLVQQQKLSLNDSLYSFFPEFPDYAKEITIRDLLHHTSGVRDLFNLKELKGFRKDDYYDDAEVMGWLTAQPSLNFTPGEEFLYSNSGYWLLGQIVQKVTGASMATFADNEIFKPLKMSSTLFHNNHNRIVKNKAYGYTPFSGSEFEINMSTLDLIGDGGILTTIEDLKKWDDEFYQQKVFDKSFWEMMTTVGKLNNGASLEYASGLRISDYKGLKQIDHAGWFGGFKSNLIRFPEQKLSVIVLANREDAYSTGLAHQVADLYLSQHFKKEVGSELEFIELNAEQLKGLPGHYWSGDRNDSRHVYIKEGKLKLSPAPKREYDLAPLSETQFKLMGVSANVIITFMPKSRQMSVSVNGREPFICDQYMPANYTKEQLAQFTGRFYSEALMVNYQIKVIDGELQLYIGNRQVSKLDAPQRDMLVSRSLGVINIERDSEDTITGFKLSSNRVKHVQFEKILAK
ncbi:serine hydrolase domain-containing protein [Shewanella nanhaiensis]|uniref:Beta-lactamase family protein n=1 Tax=Shewanella nanhaiensis TaxID=2864872 RepID=A0ABS7E8P5_9GAMM|nr:serine hydrolase domain-containing protein [Shewanella nanhaiensis]MBW8185698.1 beta-lactamase family protein [Shewanella nanhaiensis]